MLSLLENCARAVFWLIGFFLLAIALIIYTGSANSWITTHLSTALSDATGMQVEIQNARLEFPLTIKADNLSLGTPESPSFTANQMSVDWNLQELLRGNFVVRSLEVDTLEIHALKSSAPSLNADQNLLPPQRFSIDALQIHHLLIAPELLKTFGLESLPATVANWHIQGSFQMDAHAALKSSFDLQTTDKVLAFVGTLYGTTNDFSLATDFKTSELQIGEMLLKTVQGNIKLNGNLHQQQGNIYAAALLENHPLELSSDFSLTSNDLLNLSELAIKTSYGNAYGQLQISLNEKWMLGELQADTVLENLTPLAKGIVTITGHFSGDETSPIHLLLKSPLLETEHLQLENIQVDVTLSDLFQEPHLNARTSIGKILFPPTISQNAVTGSISAQGTLSGPLNAPKGQFDVSFANVMLADERWSHIPAIDGLIHLVLANNKLAYQAKLASQIIPSIDFAGNIPLNVSLAPFHIAIDRQLPIAGHVTAQGELGAALQLFFPDLTLFSGKMTVTGDMAGSLDRPSYQGMMDIKQGLFEIGATGTVLRNLDAHLESNGETILLTSLSATDSASGKITGKGSASLDASKHYPFSIAFDVQNSVLWQQDYAAAAFSGQLELVGTNLAAKLAGTVNCDQATITIPDQIEALVDTVEVTYINQPAGVLPPQTFITAPSSWPITFDIAIQAPETVSINSRELDSTWKGKLTIAGTTDAPLFFGEFKIVEGYYLFNGQNFSIDQGLITLAGDFDKKMSLYVIATKDLGKVKVEVILKGSTRNPAISFRSNPPLSQREILSWILFNRGTSEISSFQGNQLRESITNLGSTQKQPDVLTKFRNALGIDRIDICKGGGEDGETVGVQVGKYISQNVFVSINKSDVNRLAIEAALVEHIKLQAEIGDDAQGNLMLKWKRDY